VSVYSPPRSPDLNQTYFYTELSYNSVNDSPVGLWRRMQDEEDVAIKLVCMRLCKNSGLF
jgi:hypothetical protein